MSFVAKRRLFCPGPTPVPFEVVQATSDVNVYHRTEEFYRIALDCRVKLGAFFGQHRDRPLILTSSGTGAMEAAVQNFTAANDAVITINGGKFGERWMKMLSAYQCQVATLTVPWGQSPDVTELTKLMNQTANVRAVFLQANETSTGVAFPIKELALAIRAAAPHALIVVDAISGLVAQEVNLEGWDLDVVLSGSQKGFGLPPGLSFIAVSERGWNHLSNRPRFYFDLARERKEQETGATAWTPATTLILGLHAALQSLHKVGPDFCIAHHKRLADACRSTAEPLGLKLFAESHHSNSLTAFALPEGFEGGKLVKRLRERFGAIFAGGQDHMKGKMLRMAHLGFTDELDLVSGIAALELVLTEMRGSKTAGAGVAAAVSSLAKH